jgi:hypothetical protein
VKSAGWKWLSEDCCKSYVVSGVVRGVSCMMDSVEPELDFEMVASIPPAGAIYGAFYSARPNLS